MNLTRPMVRHETLLPGQMNGCDKDDYAIGLP